MSLHGRKPWSSEPFSEANNEDRRSKEKLFYFGLLVVFLFGVLTLQLARMQLVNGETYEQRAETNRLRIEPILPSRGLIYDSTGKPLVENVPSYAAAVVAADIPAGRETEISVALQELTGVPAGDIEQTITEREDSNDPFTPATIKDNLTQETAFAIREKLADLPGVRVVVEPQRHYLDNGLLAHILGFVGPVYQEDYAALAPAGYQLNDRVGKAGVEYTYESLLRGSTGSRAVETDASGREIQVLDQTPATPGLNVVLSIDEDLQQHVADILRAGMGASLNAAAVIVDVHTGDILSMVSLPSYDSNIFTGEVDQNALNQLSADPAKPMLNHAISEMYAPGSTFKQITGLASLQEGVANAGTQITSNGYIQVRSEFDPNTVYTFKDWRSDLGTMNFYRGLAMSSDVYFYYLAGGYSENGKQLFKGLGATKLAEWARRFGLGEETGIDLPGESTGLVPDPTWKEETVGEPWLLGDTYNFGIGQGYVNATPLQMALVTAAVANGGDVLAPHVVKELKDGDGNTVQIARQNVRRNLNVDPRNLNILREAMRQSVADGAAVNAQVRNVQVAGKTGTAEFGEQRPDGSYKEHGWFTGFAPFNDPEIAVVVFMEQGNGGGTAAPTAAKILDYYFNQRNVAESNPR
ncbi:MAG TPA: penicillin-binding protein 2 [Dehalococcoidia bacterium]|nr:penicillin-binding protein 2 [Dehalococcoidia bacterium]